MKPGKVVCGLHHSAGSDNGMHAKKVRFWALTQHHGLPAKLMRHDINRVAARVDKTILEYCSVHNAAQLDIQQASMASADCTMLDNGHNMLSPLYKQTYITYMFI